MPICNAWLRVGVTETGRRVISASPDAARILNRSPEELAGMEPDGLLEGLPATEIALSDTESVIAIEPGTLQQENVRLKLELDAANDALRAKTSFLSSMSHDIRTPMNAIVGMTSIAKNHLDERTRVKDCLGKIETASAHLMSLINDVLDMSRIDSGRATVSEEEFSLPDLIHDLNVLAFPLAAAKKQRLRLDCEGITAERLIGDALYLRQVFMNIISNSVKYTDEGGEISVGFSEEPAGDGRLALRFVCRDNGIGMSGEFLARIFEPFAREETAVRRGTEGTGLGMAITKRLIDKMGGEIEVKSALGAGSTFTVTIPLAVGQEDGSWEALRGKTVLLIEPDTEVSSAAEACLVSAGITPVKLESDSAAVIWITERQFEGALPDAVLLGLALGENRMLELASHLRSQLGEDVPILLLTWNDWGRIEYVARRAGITGFIPCPIFRGRLLRELMESAADADGGGRESFAGMRILLAEDNELNREIAIELIHETGAEVDAAENGQEALDMFSASAVGYYDLVLMDVQMPVMDGYEAVRRIRALPRSDAGKVCIAAMTANAFVEDIKKSRDAGMDEHLSKPVDYSKLEELLRRRSGR